MVSSELGVITVSLRLTITRTVAIQEHTSYTEATDRCPVDGSDNWTVYCYIPYSAPHFMSTNPKFFYLVKFITTSFPVHCWEGQRGYWSLGIYFHSHIGDINLWLWYYGKGWLSNIFMWSSVKMLAFSASNFISLNNKL